MLEYLSGMHIDRLHASHRRELEDWQHKYQQSNDDREASIDSIARAMAELAAVSGAPATPTTTRIPLSAITTANTITQQEVPISSETVALVEISREDMPKCTNCKTCYQDLSELFEKTKIMVGNEAKEVSRVIPGILDKIEITPELVQRAARVADDCDVEIIRFHRPA